jgi:NADPH:quinone reductase-like Zn-dependent oxidoreductase
MRAAIVKELGRLPEVGEVDDPAVGEGQVVAEVIVAGLNPVDIAMASGTFPGDPPAPPYVPGREGIARTEDGGRGYFEVQNGAIAELCAMDREALVPVPDGVDDALATAFGVAGTAAWLGLERTRVHEGDTVLVLGASGVVGQIGVQAAGLMGATRVVAAARDPDGLQRAKELGADATVRMDDSDDLAEAFREATGGGPDVVLDPLWGEPAEAAVEAAAKGARIAHLGQSAGTHASLRSGAVRMKELSILGHSNFAVSREDRQAACRRMLEHCAAGELTVDVKRIPLDSIAEAWELQGKGPHRKLAIVP